MTVQNWIECGFGSRLGSERRDKEEGAMSLASGRESWVDRWWLLLLILFGVIFVTFIVVFKPMS